MKVYIGADHRGFGFKKKIIAMLEQLGHKVIDLGTYTDQQPCDYPDVARDVGEHVAKDRDTRGILVCMSGIGLTIAANKIKGIYAALCYNLETAELSRLHNNANVLVLSAKFIPEKDVFQMLETWMTTPFEGGRHLPRVKKIMEMEDVFDGKPRPKSAVSLPAPVESPRVVSTEPQERSERPESRPVSGHRNDREERPRSAQRPVRRDTGRPTFSTGKPSFRKDEGRSFTGAKKPYAAERTYGKSAGRADKRHDERPSYASRKPDSRTSGSGQGKSSYAGARPERQDRPRTSGRGPRRDEARPYSSGKPSFRKDDGRSSSGPKKPYAGGRAYAKPAGRSDSRGDNRPSYASRKPDARSANRSERKPFVSSRPKPSGAGSSAPRKKFDKS